MKLTEATLWRAVWTILLTVIVWKAIAVSGDVRRMSDSNAITDLNASITWRQATVEKLLDLRKYQSVSGRADLANKSDVMIDELNEEITWLQRRMSQYIANSKGDTSINGKPRSEWDEKIKMIGLETSFTVKK